MEGRKSLAISRMSQFEAAHTKRDVMAAVAVLRSRVSLSDLDLRWRHVRLMILLWADVVKHWYIGQDHILRLWVALASQFLAVFDGQQSVAVLQSFRILQYCSSLDTRGEPVELIRQNYPISVRKQYFLNGLQWCYLALRATRMPKKLIIYQKCHQVPFRMSWLI